MIGRATTVLRSCPVCSTVLEHYSHPPTLGSYLPCVQCARLYRVTDAGMGLEAVDLAVVAPELAQAVRDVFRAYWSNLAA